MKVFVLAPVHNRKNVTLEFLESFVRQTYKEYEVVIVDDGSTDGTSEAIRKRYPKTVILYGDGSLWWTGSMRKGVEHILKVANEDDFILAINDDVTVKRDYIEKLVSTSRGHDNAIVGSIYRDNKNEEIVYDSGVKIDWKNYRYQHLPYNKNSHGSFNVDTLATRGTLIPIKVFSNIGIFERKLKHYAADYEYFLRAKRMGFKLYISYDVSVYGSEKDRKIIEVSKIQSFRSIWKRNFNIKSAYNIYNHIYIIWYYCPFFLYKIKHSVLLVSYNVLLFLNSIFLYPLIWIYSTIMKNGQREK